MRELGCTINVYVTVLHIPIITTWVNRASRWYKDHSDTGPCPSLKDVLDWDRADLRLGTSEIAETAKRMRKAYNDLLRKQEITLSVGEVVQNAGVAGGAGRGRKPKAATPAANGEVCRDFKNGRCNRGAGCRFEHPTAGGIKANPAPAAAPAPA